MIFRILTSALDPATILLFLMAVTIVLIMLKKYKPALLVSLISLFSLVMFSIDPIAHLLLRSLEKKYSPSSDYPQVSAVVLLGGSELPANAPRIYDETNESADRIFYAARLMKKSYAPRLVITGGNPGSASQSSWTEAMSASNMLQELFNIDSSKILLEQSAKNTHENALYTAKMFDSLQIRKSIILVTSAYHMPRSVLAFKKSGFTVFAAPTDYYEESKYVFNFARLFPDSEALNKSRLFLHEFIGLIIYRIVGWA